MISYLKKTIIVGKAQDQMKETPVDQVASTTIRILVTEVINPMIRAASQQMTLLLKIQLRIQAIYLHQFKKKIGI